MASFHADFVPHWTTWGERYAHRAARGLTKDSAERQDLVQEGAIAFSDAISKASGAVFRRFAYTAIHRAMVRYIQYRGRVVRAPRGEPFAVVESLDIRDEEGRTKAELLSQHDTACSEPRDIRASVQEHCTARQWEIVRAKYYEGMSKEEIAKALNCPPGSQYNIEKQALKKLRKKLRGAGGK